MLTKLLSLALAGLLAHAVGFVTPRPVGAAGDSDALFAAKVKAEVAKLGAGSNARVKVRLRDKTKLEGYVSEVAEEHFVVTDSKTGKAVTVSYSEVEKVKGNNLSAGAKIGIAVAVAAAVGVIIAVVAGRGGGRNDSPCARRDVTTPCPPGCVCAQ